MEGKKSTKNSRVILLFGAPCCGKTTFGQNFAKKFNLTFYNLTEMKENNHFTKKQLHAVLSLIAETGQNLVLEGELDSEKSRNEIRNLFRRAGYTPNLVWIQTDTVAIKKRLKTRVKTLAEAKQYFETRIAGMEVPSPVENAIVISGKHTFETQTRHVLTGLK